MKGAWHVGNWNINVQGVGAHHNADYHQDANRMASQFVQALIDAGHTVQSATFTSGSADNLLPVLEVETLAKALHEAGREAVEKGKVVNKVHGQPFMGWDEITEDAREGRRIMARYLLARFAVLAPRW
jgi:hypothetical protein